MSSDCIRRINRELDYISKNRSNYWSIRPGGGYDILKLEGTIQNLDDPKHDGKIYRLLIEVPRDYPFHPVKVKFLDKVKCENIYYNGNVCMDILTTHWSPVFTISTLMESICSLLTDKPVTGLVNKIHTTREEVRNNISNIIIRNSDVIQDIQYNGNIVNQIIEQVPRARRRRTELEMLSV